LFPEMEGEIAQSIRASLTEDVIY